MCGAALDALPVPGTLYRTVHRPRVAIRAKPSTQAEIVHVLSAGEVFRVSWRFFRSAKQGIWYLAMVFHGYIVLILAGGPTTSIKLKVQNKLVPSFLFACLVTFFLPKPLFEDFTPRFLPSLRPPSSRHRFSLFEVAESSESSDGWVQLAADEAWARSIVEGFVLVDGAAVGSKQTVFGCLWCFW